MDQEIDELKELVRQNITLSQETNKMVHAMRRSARLGTIMRALWWVVVFGGSALAYYYYVQPYVDQIMHVYSQAQAGGQQAQSFGKTIAAFFAQFVPKQ